jgi:hypothetical protein
MTRIRESRRNRGGRFHAESPRGRRRSKRRIKSRKRIRRKIKSKIRT